MLERTAVDAAAPEGDGETGFVRALAGARGPSLQVAAQLIGQGPRLFSRVRGQRIAGGGGGVAPQAGAVEDPVPEEAGAEGTVRRPGHANWSAFSATLRKASAN